MRKSPKGITNVKEKSEKRGIYLKVEQPNRFDKVKKSCAKRQPNKSFPQCQVRNIFTGECEVSKNDEDGDNDDDEADEEREYYLNLFLEYVDELPFITYEEDKEQEAYTKEMLIEDIINIIKDIYEQTEYVLIPDSETMLEIATLKFDNESGKHSKEVKEFLFGTQRGNDAIHDKIREFTRKVEPIRIEKMEEKYKRLEEMNPNEPPLYDSEGTVSDSEDILMKAVERLDIKEIKVKCPKCNYFSIIVNGNTKDLELHRKKCKLDKPITRTEKNKDDFERVKSRVVNEDVLSSFQVKAD